MTNPETPLVEETPQIFDLIDNFDSREVYPVIKPEFAADCASKSLKRLAAINKAESANEKRLRLTH